MGETRIVRKAFSRQQFLNFGFDGSEYSFPDFEGTYGAVLVCKCWGKNKNLLAYLDLDNGKKIITSAWQNTNYMGLENIPLGSHIIVTFQLSKGNSFLRKVELI
jgi:hypothetical protein